MPRHVTSTLLLGAFAIACTEDSATTAPFRTPRVSHVVSGGGNTTTAAGFYFRPPLVPSAVTTGTPDGTLAPVVDVLELIGGTGLGKEIARFSTTTGTAAQVVRYDPASEQYIVNWQTDQCSWGPCILDPARAYRLRVSVGAAELAHADVQVVPSQQQAKNSSGQYFTLVNGRTFPVKFRIEQGAVAIATVGGSPTPVGTTGGTIASADGKVALVIPPAAVATTTAITVEAVPAASVPAEPNLVPGTAYDFGPDGTQFATPITITLGYDPANLPAGVAAGDLGLFRIEADGRLTPLPFSAADPARNTVSGLTTHFSKYVVGGQAAASSVKFVAYGWDPYSTLSASEAWKGARSSLPITLQDASGNFLYGRQVSVSTSNPSIVSVDSTSLAPAEGSVDGYAAAVAHLTGLSLGTATITAKSQAGTATITVTVVPAPVGAVAISPTAASVSVGGSTQLTAIVTDPLGNMLIGRLVTWTSFDPQYATVSSAGVVAGIRSGRTMVTATVEGVSASAVVTVGNPAPFANVASISAGARRTCAIGSVGNAYCWGTNLHGKLGTGDDVDHYTPTAVAGNLAFQSISAGGYTTCGIASSGLGYCWGAGVWGLGDGTSDVALSPRQLAGGLTFKSISAGAVHACGLTTAGAAYCWGYGFGASPVPVFQSKTFVSISTGGEGSNMTASACALTAAGEAFCWGSGYTSPNRFSSLAFSSVSLGVSPHVGCGLVSTGEAYCWNGGSSTPVSVSSSLSFRSVSVGWGFEACGLTAAGEVYCWNPRNGVPPTRRAPGLSFVALSFYESHVCAVTSSKTVFCWGNNESGGLGDGTTISTDTPVQVIGP